jgi:hypothetical protein
MEGSIATNVASFYRSERVDGTIVEMVPILFEGKSWSAVIVSRERGQAALPDL